MKQNIPKILHQIWLEPTPPPEQWLNSWRQKHPSWDYHLWTNDNLPALYNQKQFDLINSHSGKTHILRYELLHQFGGVYLDADSECLHELDAPLLRYHFFSCYENEKVRPGLIANDVIGSEKGHPLLKEILNSIQRLKDINCDPVNIAVGPFFFTKMFRQYQVMHGNVAALPSHFFYPEHYTGERYQGRGKVYARQHWHAKEEQIQAYPKDPVEFINAHGKELEIVAKFLPENPMILEAGAHYGEDTVKLSKKWPKGKIFAFEPNPKAFERLREEVKNQTNVTIFPFGLFSKTAEIGFWVNPGDEGASSILEDNRLPEFTEYYKGAYQIPIFCMNLDEWAKKEGITHIDYMWLDLEGVEGQVLSSAPNILKTVQVISTEVNFRRFRKEMTLFSELELFLKSQGFILYKLMGTPGWQATAIFRRP